MKRKNWWQPAPPSARSGMARSGVVRSGHADPTALARAAFLEGRQGNYAAALLLCDRARAARGEDLQVLCTRGACLLALGRLDQALAAVQQAVRLAPADPDAAV